MLRDQRGGKSQNDLRRPQTEIAQPDSGRQQQAEKHYLEHARVGGQPPRHASGGACRDGCRRISQREMRLELKRCRENRAHFATPASVNGEGAETCRISFAEACGVAGYCSGRQVAPPSEVAKRRPPTAKIVASDALEATTSTKSSLTGAITFVQCSPSTVRKIVPPCPTTQQVVVDGADPRVRSAVTPLLCATHPVAGL